MKQRAILAIFVMLAVICAVVVTAIASSHREAPGILSTPQVDGTDFYMFRSYEEGRILLPILQRRLEPSRRSSTGQTTSEANRCRSSAMVSNQETSPPGPR